MKEWREVANEMRDVLQHPLSVWSIIPDNSEYIPDSIIWNIIPDSSEYKSPDILKDLSITREINK